MNAKELLTELIKINSESENEKQIGEYIIERLKKRFKIKKQEINKKTQNFNILAYIGNPKIILEAHLDTVPGQLKIKETEEFICGRGACDNKSQITTMILAAEKAIEQNVTDFGLLFTVQEETDFAGAEKAIELIPESVELVVVGEPTNFKIVDSQKGLLSLKLIAKGKKAHGSTPEKGVNAIEILIDNLEKLKKIEFEKNEELGESSLNIGTIKGGEAMNVVPDYAESIIEFRATVKPERILNQVKEKLKNIEIEVINSYEPILSEVKEIAERLNLETQTIPSFTELYFFNKKAKTFSLGVDKFGCHSQDEKVRISDLNKLIDIYLQILENQIKTLTEYKE